MEIGVHVGAIRAYLEAAGKNEVERNKLLGELQIPESILNNGNSKLPLSKMRHLQKLARSHTGDSSIDLRAGYDFAVGTFGTFHYLMQSRSTLRESIHDLIRYGRLISEYASYSLREEGSHARFSKHLLVAENLIDPQTSAFCMAAVLSSTRKIIGENWRPLEVRFRQRHSDSDTLFHEIFEAPVRFGCGTDELIFSLELLNRRVLTQDRLLGSVLESLLSGSTSLHCGEGFVEEITQIIATQFLSGLPNINDVAQQKGLNPRALQRSLQKKQTSFGVLLDQVRKDLAGLYVFRLGMTKKEAGVRLHFSDPAAFSRAFRRWYGQHLKDSGVQS